MIDRSSDGRPTTDLRTCFVHGGRHLGSASIRGVQIAEALGCAEVPLKQFTAATAADYATVVYVKRMPAVEVMREVRRGGTRQLFDVLDNYGSWHLRSRLALLDGFIGASFTQTVALEKRHGLPAAFLPHHHCNFSESRIEPGRTPPTLGYVGDRHHWPATKWVTRSFPQYPVVVDMEHRNLHASYSGIDIGFAYRADPRKRSYNSAIKLVNYMSFGIPAVMTPESAYTEVARHGTHALFAQSKSEFGMLLGRLAKEPALRADLGAAAYEAARPYHIRHVAVLYRSYLES
jgi:hypothetical protein